MASVVAGGADREERIEVEAHVARCARCATAYADLAATAVALDIVTLLLNVRLVTRPQEKFPAALFQHHGWEPGKSEIQ
jgi:anti-sigma factor RsiW